MVASHEVQSHQKPNNSNISSCPKKTARHPNRHMACAALHESRTQKLSGASGNKHDEAFHQTAPVQEGEPGAGYGGGEGEHPAFVEMRHGIDAGNLGISLRWRYAIGKFRNELTQQVNLVGVNAHRALLGNFSTEITVCI